MIRALRHALLAVPGALRQVNANSTFGTEGQLPQAAEWPGKRLENLYPLVNVYITIENHHF